ncbi:MAG TPA: right-handed parallel beta-helix repeat-containing protein [Mucilaginibacter sp.]|jgi:hypothetical protein
MSFNKYRLSWFAGIIAALLISIKSFATTPTPPKSYYVNTQGTDINPGTKSAPFQTIKKLNSIRLNAGDIVYFQSGQTFNGTIEIDSVAQGSKSNPIIISAYGNGMATIDADSASAISLYKAQYIVISKLHLIGSGRKSGNTKSGLSLINCDHINIDSIEISGFQKSGLFVFASKQVNANHVSAHDNGSAGITVEGDYGKKNSENIKIINCRAENNPGDPTNLTNHSGNGIVVGNCKNILIDRCTATNNGWDMPRIGNGPVGIWAYEADSVIIQNCLSYRNKTSKGGADGGGFDLDGGVTNSIVQYCVSYENQGSGYCIFQYWGASPWHHNIFRYNISENDGTVSDSQAGLYVWNSSDDEKQFYDCDVYSNIIYNDRVAAISFSEKSESKGIRFYNNIFVGSDSLIRGKDKIGDVKYQGNDWWSLKDGFNIDGIKQLKTWANKTGNEMKDGKVIGLNEFPEFKNPGKADITIDSQISSFTNYQLPKKSKLKDKLKLLQLKSNY